jgi:hypothetical protein
MAATFFIADLKVSIKSDAEKSFFAINFFWKAAGLATRYGKRKYHHKYVNISTHLKRQITVMFIPGDGKEKNQMGESYLSIIAIHGSGLWWHVLSQASQ